MPAAVDKLPKHPVYADAPYSHAQAVTPSDTTDLTYVTRAILCGGAGNLNVIMQDGTTVLITGVLAGQLLPIRASRVKATSTTATNITAFA